MKIRFVVLVGSLLFLLTGCSLLNPITAEPVGSCSLTLAPQASDDDAIHALLRSEGELVVTQEIDGLMRLWLEDGFVADAKNTPATNADDQFWRGSDAVRHRYVRVVFPGAPSAVIPADLDIRIDGEHAEVLATTSIGNEIGNEIAKAGDRWTFVQARGCWLIESLTYNLESK